MGQFDKEFYEFKSGDGHLVRLEEPVVYLADSGTRIVAPKGFWSDGASVPRILWRILPPFGDYWRAAILHDYMYFRGAFVRSKCDRLFLEAMRSCKVNRFKAWVIYTGVRIGGWKAYGNYRKKEKEKLK